jgi:hypothetical protein
MQPTISKDQYAALITGNGQGTIRDSFVWHKLLPRIVAEPASSKTTATIDANGNITPPTDASDLPVLRADNLPDSLYIARRSGSSGTTAATEMFFLGNPCNLNQNARGVTFNNNLVAQGAVTTVDETMMEEAYYGGVVKGDATDIYVAEAASSSVVAAALVNAGADATKNYTIGVLSLENAMPTNNDSSTADWKFLKIDGVSPVYLADGTQDLTQKVSLIDGRYSFQYASEIMGVPVGTMTALQTSLWTALTTLWKNHDKLSTAKGVFGYGSVPNATVNATDTAHYDRSGNQCAPLSLTY